MAINLHEKYAKQIQAKFVKESFITGMLTNSYSFSGVKTVKISTPITVPMVDYKRSGASRYGTPDEMQDVVQ
jgi:ribosomal protein S2